MRIGSLFSGVGGLERGLELAGFGPVEWQCEIDPFCREVLEKHWPGVPRFDAIQDMCFDEPVMRVEVLCGGFPCQDLSQAGNRRGLAGARSGLWFEFARAIDEMRPRAVLIENVRGFLGRPLDTVGTWLHDRHYAVEVTRIHAADVGAPHRRERVFVLAVADADGDPVRDEPGRGRGAGWSDPPESRNARELADPDRRRREVERIAEHGELEREPGDLADGRDPRGRGNGTDVPDTGGAGRRDDGRREEARRTARGAAHAGHERDAQPRVGRAAHGLSGGLDGPGPGGAWPAGRDQAQHAWEAPRTIPRGLKLRPARLHALGNSVVPQCAYIAGLRLRELLGVSRE